MAEKPEKSSPVPKKLTPFNPLQQLHELAKVDWDPISSKRPTETPSPQCLLRVKRDMMTMYSDPPPGIFAVPDSRDLTIVHALITGSFDTPYEGGFFYFLISCPPDYPIRPPRVRFMTTGGGTVRFNPNLYKGGKICLSILGTWTGPTWSPAQSLSSVLISIQSILNDKPYHNEPSYETERCPGDVARYNEIIQHETLRVAVCGMIENDTLMYIPKALIDVMEKTFLEFYDFYTATAKKKIHLHGQQMQDPFRDDRGTFQYKSILKRLETLYAKISVAQGSHGSQGDKTSDECSEISDTEMETTEEPPTKLAEDR